MAAIAGATEPVQREQKGCIFDDALVGTSCWYCQVCPQSPVVRGGAGNWIGTTARKNA